MKRRVRVIKSSHQNALELYLDRIATALENMSDALGDGVQNIPVITPIPVNDVIPGDLGRPRGNPGRCGRCKREGRRRMNGKQYCRSCQHEGWWDE